MPKQNFIFGAKQSGGNCYLQLNISFALLYL